MSPLSPLSDFAKDVLYIEKQNDPKQADADGFMKARHHPPGLDADLPHTTSEAMDTFTIGKPKTSTFGLAASQGIFGAHRSYDLFMELRGRSQSIEIARNDNRSVEPECSCDDLSER